MNASNLHCPTCSKPMQITRYRCESCNLNVDGQLELPPLAQLDIDEQVFVTAFMRSHGSIKRMEALFDISYPTVKNKLNAIARKLDAAVQAPDSKSKVLDRLHKGEITVAQALAELDKA